MSIVCVELDRPPGDPGFLRDHPAIRRIEPTSDGGLSLWVDDTCERDPTWAHRAPDRAADLELHGPGAPAQALVEHPRAEYVKVFVDAMGDPLHAPRGWWHARLWLRAA